MEQADRCGVSSDAGIVPDRCGEEGAGRPSSPLTSPSTSRPSPVVMSSG